MILWIKKKLINICKKHSKIASIKKLTFIYILMYVKKNLKINRMKLLFNKFKLRLQFLIWIKKK